MTLTATDLSHRYLWGPAVDQLMADEQLLLAEGGGYDLNSPGNAVWAFTDNENTVRDLAVYDSGTTTLVNHRVFSSYGQLLSQTNLSATPAPTVAAIDCLFAYTGRPMSRFHVDSESGAVIGIQNNLNRWYDAITGRWLGQDSIWDGVNPYRYCRNGPLTHIDPMGLLEIKIGGWVFYVHRNDADPFPSQPHGHVGSPSSPLKVNVETGELFRGAVPTGETIGRKTLAALRQRLRGAGLLCLAVVIVLETPDMVQAAQEGGLPGVAKHSGSLVLKTAVGTGALFSSVRALCKCSVDGRHLHRRWLGSYYCKRCNRGRRRGDSMHLRRI